MLYDNGPLPAPRRPIGAYGSPQYTPPARPQPPAAPTPQPSDVSRAYLDHFRTQRRPGANRPISPTSGMTRPAISPPQMMPGLPGYQLPQATQPPQYQWIRTHGSTGTGPINFTPGGMRNVRDHLGNLPGDWDYQGAQQRPGFRGYQPFQYAGNPYLPQLM